MIELRTMKPIQAIQIDKAPVLDGKLDDACWQIAEPVTGFVEMHTNRPARYQSTGYICYDGAHLYVAVKCLMPKGVKPRGELRPHDSQLTVDDVVEIMLDPGLTRTRYYHFMVNAYGSKYDALNEALKGDPSWNADWTAATHIAEGYWSLEVAIPFHILELPPGVGPTWGFNLCREGKVPHTLDSSIAENGAFHDTRNFTVLNGLNVDFQRHCMQIGPAFTRLDPTCDRPRAHLRIPIRNMTGSLKTVSIERWDATSDEQNTVESQVVTLEADEVFDLPAELMELDPIFPNRNDIFIIESSPRTKKILVRDEATSTVLASWFVKWPFYCDVMRIAVNDPWHREMRGEKSRTISLTVDTCLDTKWLQEGELIVELRARENGEIVSSETHSGPSETTDIVFSADELPWDAYEVQARFQDDEGREIVASSALATVLPGGKYQIRVLNNLVSELMNAAERGLLGETQLAFMNPRSGWVFFSFRGEGVVTLESEAKLMVEVSHDQGPVEAMRRLPAGRQTLQLDGHFDQIIVRAVPELIYHSYPDGPGSIGIGETLWNGFMPLNSIPYWTEGSGLGGHDWQFLMKHILANCNVLVANFFKSPDDRHLREWSATGREWIGGTGVPGYNSTALGVDGGKGIYASADRCFAYWTLGQGFQHPLGSGAIADEFSVASEEQYLAYANALRRVASDPRYQGKRFYSATGQFFGSDANRAFLKVILEAGWPFIFYKYIPEPRREEQAREWIRANLIQCAESCNAEGPGVLRQAIASPGIIAFPPMSQNVDPNTNFKVVMEMQFESFANVPVYFGLGGVEWYDAASCGEEYVRWASRLQRHYAIEGNTTRLCTDPYQLSHLQNPDFEDGTDGWTVSEAEPGAVTVKHLDGYGVLQGRYLGGSRGDCFLVMKRSEVGPNRFSQQIKNLKPGGLYSLKVITADYGNISQRISAKQTETIAIELEKVEIEPGPKMNYEFTYPNEFPGNTGAANDVPGPDSAVRRHNAWMTYHWRVFRTQGPTATLTFSDWASPQEPGGPFGQEVMVNFIEIEPYFEAEK